MTTKTITKTTTVEVEICPICEEEFTEISGGRKIDYNGEYVCRSCAEELKEHAGYLKTELDWKSLCKELNFFSKGNPFSLIYGIHRWNGSLPYISGLLTSYDTMHYDSKKHKVFPIATNLVLTREEYGGRGWDQKTAIRWGSYGDPGQKLRADFDKVNHKKMAESILRFKEDAMTRTSREAGRDFNTTIANNALKEVI